MPNSVAIWAVRQPLAMYCIISFSLLVSRWPYTGGIALIGVGYLHYKFYNKTEHAVGEKSRIGWVLYPYCARNKAQ